jgi:hypothetical protein
MTVDMSPDESVATATDMRLSVTDTSGHTWSDLVSHLNPWGVTRMPSSTSPNLGKIVLQQIHVPTSALAAAGLKLNSIAQVTFTPAVGTDAAASGGAYLSDLDFDSKGLGTAHVQRRPTVNVASTTVEEGSGVATDHVAVYLSKPSTAPVTAYLTVIGSTTGKVGVAMQPVTFAPGTTCRAVAIPVTGDALPGAAPTTAYKIAVSNPANAVLGSHDFGTVTVREDDGVTGTAAPAPPVGAQGDVCAEYDGLSHPGKLRVSDPTPLPAQPVTVTGTGYRDGESVAFTLGSLPLGSAVADTHGTVRLTVAVPVEQPVGGAVISALGAGSGRTSTATVHVLRAARG